MDLKDLYQNYNNLVYNLALQYVQNVEDAQEITQDVFVAVHNSMDSFQNKSKISTWIYRITINKSLDYIKAKKRKKRFAFVTAFFSNNHEIQQESIEFNHPGVILEQKEITEMIFDAINKLPSNQKTALILSKIEQKNQAEVAEIMNISVNAVDSLVQRAKKNLKSTLSHIEGME